MIALLGLFKRFIPMKAIIIGTVVVSVGLCGYFYGKRSEALQHEQALRIAVQEAQEAEREYHWDLLDQLEEFYEERLKDNVRIEKETVEVIRFVESDAGSNQCFDDDGMRIINGIIAKDVPGTTE